MMLALGSWLDALKFPAILKKQLMLRIYGDE